MLSSNLLIALIVLISTVTESTPLSGHVVKTVPQTRSLEVVSLGIRPAKDVMLQRRSKVWRYVDPYAAQYTTSTAQIPENLNTNHLECNNDDHGIPLRISINGDFDLARRQFCSSVDEISLPQGYEFSIRINGLKDINGVDFHLVGLIGNTGSLSRPGKLRRSSGLNYKISSRDCLDATDIFMLGWGQTCLNNGLVRGGYHWIHTLGVAFEVYPMRGSADINGKLAGETTPSTP